MYTIVSIIKCLCCFFTFRKLLQRGVVARHFRRVPWTLIWRYYLIFSILISTIMMLIYNVPRITNLIEFFIVFFITLINIYLIYKLK